MDISLRLNKEMLVLSGSIEAGLERLGVDIEHDLAIANILEPETIKTSLDSYVVAGAQCLIANSKNVLQANLAFENLDNKISEIAKASLNIAKSCKPQHIIVELGNCQLPLDDFSKNSLNEFKNQYVNSARIFEALDLGSSFDAYLLSDLKNLSQIKCALMGLKQVSDKPIIVSSQFDNAGNLNKNENIYDYANILAEFGATVAGIKINSEPEEAKKLIKRLRAGCDLPILVEVDVLDDKNSSYYSPDSMKSFACMANDCGIQFLRATGHAKPSHTAVLTGTCLNMPINHKIGI